MQGDHIYQSAASLNLVVMRHFFLQNPNPVDMKLTNYIELAGNDPFDTTEVSQAVRTCSNTSAPGPGQVLYSVWKGIHRVNCHIIPTLVNHLLEWSINPLWLKDLLGILLPKPSTAN